MKRRGDLDRFRRRPRPAARAPAPLPVARAAPAPLPPDPLPLVGNARGWEELLRWARRPEGRACVLSGPPGVGKTLGVHRIARAASRRVVLVQGGELSATESACASLGRELRVAATRASVTTPSDRSAPLLLLDDMDDVDDPRLQQQVREFVAAAHAGPVVLVYGRHPPRWLDAALRATCLRVCVQPLARAELVKVVHSHVDAGRLERPRPAAFETYLAACGGDARSLLNSLRVHGRAADEPAAQLDVAQSPWEAARRLLYHRGTVEAVERTVAGQPPALLGAILHANYVQAIGRGSVPTAELMDAIAERSEALSASFNMRAARGHPVPEADVVAGAGARGLGRKGKLPNEDEIRIAAPRPAPPPPGRDFDVPRCLGSDGA